MTAERMKFGTLDWSLTPLGARETWPSSLRIAVNLVMASKFPSCLVWGPDLTMIYNDAFIPILGDKHDASGRSFRDVWREAWDDIGPIVERAFNGEATYIDDFRLNIERHGKHEDAYFTFCYSPVFDESGVVVGMLDTVVETTGKVKAEHRLAAIATALEEQVRGTAAERDLIWQLASDMVLLTKADGAIVSVNPAFRSLLGWTEDDLQGQSLLDLIDPLERPDTARTLDDLHMQDGSRRVESRVRGKAGQYAHVSWSMTEHDGLVLAIGRDMSAEREAAAAIRKTELALQQAQKMEAIGRLTGGVAHDFNNLLQVISGNLQLLANDVAGNARAQRRLDSALSGVTRGAKLASYLLAFGRRQPLEPKVLKVGRLVIGMDDMLRRTLGEEFEIETIVAAGLWNSYVDATQVENAVLNLCINARDAMEGAGKLTIEVGNASLDDTYARNHDEVTPGQYVMIAVSDTGTGMSPETLRRAFDPFFSTKPEGKGTGLGLSMVFGFVKQSGGHVKIYSEVGHGTTVKLYLPRSLSNEDAIAVIDTQPVVGGQETILVAEDDEEVRTTVVEMLTGLGYRVLKANDAASALTVIDSGMPIDLLFTDVVMPGPLRSPELAKKARERLPNIAVLFTSGYTENSIVHGGKLDAGVELLGKPYTREALARRVRHVLASQAQRDSITKPAASPAPAPLLDFKTSGKPLSILLVEDEEIIRLNTVELLETLGHRVLHAGSAEDALTMLESEPIQVLITDITLPGISGEALAGQVRTRIPNVSVVYASGMERTDTSDDAIVLRKPYDTISLARALQAIETA
ncbi:response regulator [Achromobacter sp. KS-M25]|nr:response regulator [Achromobacter aestuarii]